MRLTTSLIVIVLLAIGVAVYANGMTPAEPPVGAGPGTEPSVTEPAAEPPMTEPSTEPAATEPPMTEPPAAEPPMTMPPATQPPIGTGPVTVMSPEVELFNTNNVVSTFGVDRSQVMQLRQAGWMWGDIYLMANIARMSGRPIMDVVSLRSQGMDWNAIATQFNISAAAITTAPIVPTTRVAGYVTEFGYQPIYYKTDPWGNPVLTRYEAERLSRLGYDWQNIAIAANISAQTGVPVREVLSWIDRGYTWQQVARQYGLDAEEVMDVTQYPFGRTPGTMTMPTTSQPVGAGPVMTAPPPMQPTTPTY